MCLRLVLCALPSATVLAQGALTNGVNHTETLTAGTTNSYTFTANAGDGLVFRVGTTNFTPRLVVLGPGGVVIGSAGFNNSANHDTYLTLRATNSGTFTVRVSSFFAGGTGTYGLRFGQPPGEFSVPANDEGGTLTNGAVAPGAIALGDFDMWSFTATNGNNISLRVGTTGFTPYLTLYGPNGALIGTAGFNNSFNHDTYLNLVATNSGTFTVVLMSFFYDHQTSASGDYNLTLARAPGSFVVSPGDEGGAMTNGAIHSGTIALGELDMWSVTAAAGDSIVLRVGTSGFTPDLFLYGPDGALIDSEGFNHSGNHDAYLVGEHCGWRAGHVEFHGNERGQHCVARWYCWLHALFDSLRSQWRDDRRGGHCQQLQSRRLSGAAGHQQRHVHGRAQQLLPRPQRQRRRHLQSDSGENARSLCRLAR
jgi:hypothetical protein